MDTARKLRDILTEVEDLASQKSSLESIAAETTSLLSEAQDQLKETKLALERAEKEKAEMQKQKDDVVQALAQMVQEKLTMHKEKDDAIKKIEEMRRYPETIRFSQAELEAATNNFDSNLIIGQGETGTVYKAPLCHTAVAIKRLSVDRLPNGHEIDDEVDSICKTRHPHFVILIGICRELRALVYEYMENGNLDERMNASPSLTWKQRIRIAAEICDGLLFLHSFRQGHFNLKPSNILLDANLVAKIDLGFSSIGNSSYLDGWEPNTDLDYIAPEFRYNDSQTLESDIYSFGVILLHLLTGRPALLIADDIQREVDTGNLQQVLDSRAGNWSFEQALELAKLGLACCCEIPQLRPDLQSEIWPVLDSMRQSIPSSDESIPSSASYRKEESSQPPGYFLCPILQEIMRDPQVTADGHTYEKEAIEEWLDGGHMTSPKTNLPLDNFILIPNHALRSAILEWRDRY
ncbi:unnamed protein product [Victoria cruziana]